MSREIVACVASKPRLRRRRRSCSWLWSGSLSIKLENRTLAAGFHRQRSRQGYTIPAYLPIKYASIFIDPIAIFTV